MDSTSLLGLLGGSITTFGSIPQIIKMIKTRETRDLSWYMIASWNIGLTMTLIYGILIHQMPIIITSSISVLLTMVITTLKLYYESSKIYSNYELVTV